MLDNTALLSIFLEIEVGLCDKKRYSGARVVSKEVLAMAEVSNIYLDQPDPLSVLLTRLDLTAQVYVSGDFCGTWAVGTAGSKRIPFHLVGSGKAWLHFEDRQTQDLHVHDLVIFPHDSYHIISNSQQKPNADIVNQPATGEGEVTNMTCGFFEFRNPAVFSLLDALPKVIVLKSATADNGEQVRFLINLMLSELKSEKPGFYTAIDQMALLIFVEVLRVQIEQGQLQQGLLTALFDKRLGKALNAIHQYPELSWTLETLAEQALMSRSGFADAFNKRVGLTPMKYLTKWRMNEARRLLKSSKLSVAQIAEKSGYETEAAFRKAYKKTMGEPPGEARAKQI